MLWIIALVLVAALALWLLKKPGAGVSSLSDSASSNTDAETDLHAVDNSVVSVDNNNQHRVKTLAKDSVTDDIEDHTATYGQAAEQTALTDEPVGGHAADYGQSEAAGMAGAVDRVKRFDSDNDVEPEGHLPAQSEEGKALLASVREQLKQLDATSIANQDLGVTEQQLTALREGGQVSLNVQQLVELAEKLGKMPT